RSEHSMNAGPGHARCTPEAGGRSQEVAAERRAWSQSHETSPCGGAFVPLENQDASLSHFAAMVPSRMWATLGDIGPWFFESGVVSLRESKKGRGTRTPPGRSMLVSQPLTADRGRGRPALSPSRI